MGPSKRPRSRRRCTEPEPARRPAASRRRGRARHLAGAAVLAAALGAVGGCRAPAPAAEMARAWGEGPARWLLLPAEQAALRQVRSAPELTRFLRDFWRRRDDDPASDENPFGQLFAERVVAADRLYTESGVRGSLTDRGGALLLLGPPGILRGAQRRVPAWTGNPPPGARPTRLVQLEVWAYPLRDFPSPLRDLLAGEAGERQEVTLTFLIGRHTRLVAGKELLALAARSAAGCADPVAGESPPCRD